MSYLVERDFSGYLNAVKQTGGGTFDLANIPTRPGGLPGIIPGKGLGYFSSPPPVVPTVPDPEPGSTVPTGDRQALVDELYTYLQYRDSGGTEIYWGFESRAWLMQSGNEQWVTNQDLRNLIETAKNPAQYAKELYPGSWRQFFTNLAYSLTAGGTQDIAIAREMAYNLTDRLASIPDSPQGQTDTAVGKGKIHWAWIALGVLFFWSRGKKRRK